MSCKSNKKKVIMIWVYYVRNILIDMCMYNDIHLTFHNCFSLGTTAMSHINAKPSTPSNSRAFNKAPCCCPCDDPCLHHHFNQFFLSPLAGSTCFSTCWYSCLSASLWRWCTAPSGSAPFTWPASLQVSEPLT